MAAYYDLMTATDLAGVSRADVANDDNFKFMKDLESHNLLVPVVGDLGGPKAVRAVGKYIRDLGCPHADASLVAACQSALSRRRRIEYAN